MDIPNVDLKMFRLRQVATLGRFRLREVRLYKILKMLDKAHVGILSVC